MSKDKPLLERQEQYLEALERTGSISAAARELGVDRKSIKRAIRKGANIGNGPQVSPIRSANLGYEQLKADRKRTYRRKKNHEDDLAGITIKVPETGPYGIVFLGDPHVDDDGCDWDTLDSHIGIIRNTAGLYAVNLGDTTNNWIGRLERLYANQRTTAAEAWILAEGFIQDLAGKWLFHIGGNHDGWSGSRDPLPALCAAAQATYIPDGAKVCIKAGSHEYRVNCRHKFKGSSIWNPAHGAGRSIMMGNIDHLTVGGHIHTTGQMILKAPTGRICQALQVASYKKLDSYAKAEDFRDNSISPAGMVVIDPRCREDDPAMAVIFHSIERGASYLRFLRGDQ